MRMRLVAVIAGIVWLVSAQEIDIPIIRTESRYVTVTATVRDGKGKHVSGLDRTTFHLFQGKLPVEIASVDEFVVDNTPTRANAAVRVASSQLPSTPLLHRTRPNSHTLILFDQVNATTSEQSLARQNFVAALRNGKTNNQILWLFTLDRGGLHLLGQPTANPLEAATRLEATPNLEPIPYRDIEEEPLRARDPISQGIAESATNQLTARQERNTATLITLEAMDRLAHEFKRLQGLKNVLWLGGGFPFQLEAGQVQGCAGPGCDATFQRLTEAQVAVSPIDVRGLVQFGLPSADFSNSEANTKHPEIFVEITSDRQTNAMMSSEQIAAATGGRAYTNRNDFARSLADISDDNSAYYVLTYRITPKLNVPGTHRLKLEVSSVKARVRHREWVYVPEVLPARPAKGK